MSQQPPPTQTRDGAATTAAAAVSFLSSEVSTPRDSRERTALPGNREAEDAAVSLDHNRPPRPYHIDATVLSVHPTSVQRKRARSPDSRQPALPPTPLPPPPSSATRMDSSSKTDREGWDGASPQPPDEEVLYPEPTTLSFDDITTPPPVPARDHLQPQTKWSAVKKLSDEAAKKQYVDAWLEDYNKTRETQEIQQLEWSDTVLSTYVTFFLAYAAQFEGKVISALSFRRELSDLLTPKKDRSLAQELREDAKPVLRGQFSVTTSEGVATHLNDRVPRVDPPKNIHLILIKLDRAIASLLGGASGSGKTHAAIQCATKWTTDRATDSAVEGGCVMYFPVDLEKDIPGLAKKPSKNPPTREDLVNATLRVGFENELAHQRWDGLLIMMEILDEEIQRTKNKANEYVDELYRRRAKVFVKYVERIARECTTHYEKLKNTKETIRVALVLDEVGDKQYFVRAACSFFRPTTKPLRKELGLSDSVELAVLLCGTGVGAAGCHGGSLPESYAVYMLTPTSAETLWTKLRTEYTELEVADRVSPTCRAMGSSNARMAMLLLERVTERNTGGYQQPLDGNYANVLATAESIARDAAMRFKEMNGFKRVEPKMMLELYGQALYACVWHTTAKEHLRHPDLLSKYGAVTDLRRIVGDNLVAANGNAEGRCFTMAPAMMAFFRIMLSYNCVVPVDVTGESFEHAMLHFVCAALRSCAGRSVWDFLSLIVSDANTIPEDNTQNMIPTNINETLLVLSLGHRKFDADCLRQATDVVLEISTLPTDLEEAKEARATKQVLDLAFTVEGDAQAATRTLKAKCPLVMLNGNKANAADIIVIVPDVVVCHVQCKDYLADNKLTVKEHGIEKFVEEYKKMAQSLYLAPSPHFYVISTTSPDTKLEGAIKKQKVDEAEEEDAITGRKMALLVMRVPRTSKTTTAPSPHDEKGSGCAFLQSLVALCKADGETGMIVQCGINNPAVKEKKEEKRSETS